jgi:hypothetical protein
MPRTSTARQASALSTPLPWYPADLLPQLQSTLEHRTFKWTHHRRLRDGSRIAEMQNSSDPTSRPML